MLWMGLKQRSGFRPTYRSSFKGWLMCTAPRQVPRHVPWCLATQEIISSRTTSPSVTDRLKAKPQYPACFATVALQGCPGNNFEDHTLLKDKVTSSVDSFLPTKPPTFLSQLFLEVVNSQQKYKDGGDRKRP